MPEPDREEQKRQAALADLVPAAVTLPRFAPRPLRMSGTIPGPIDDASFASADVVQRAQAGDVPARESLFRHYRPQLERFLTSRLPRASRVLLDTRDAVQEILLRALTTLSRFEYRGQGSFWAHLRTIAARFLVDQYRRSEQRPSSADTQGVEELRSHEVEPVDHAIRREDLDRFDRAIALLDARSREALLCRIEGQCEYSEVARQCGFGSADAARMAVTRALVRVGAAMAEDSG